MTYTIIQLLELDSKMFGTMKLEELKEIQEQLKAEKKDRTKQHIKPLEALHIKPLTDKFIKPVKTEFIKPLDKVLKDLKTYLPKQKAKMAYITINGQRYGPLTKKEFMEMITEVEEEEEEQKQ